MIPRVQNHVPFALCGFVHDYELGEVSVSLFTAQLRCAFIHFRIFSLTLKQIFFKVLFCEELVEWNQHNS